jgi:hypothetical protein
MSSLSIRARGRRRVAALAAGVAAFGALSVFPLQAAGAHETQVTLGMTCVLAGALPITYTVDHDPETPVAGKVLTLDVKTSVAANPAVGPIGIKSMTITIPIPQGVAGGGDVMVMGGNLTKAGQTIEAGTLVLSLTANAGVTVATLQVPELMIPVQLADEVPETIVFEGPSKLTLDVGIATETCTANADNPPLLSIKPTGGQVVAPTTKAPTTTTTRAAGTPGTTVAGGAPGEAKKPTAVKATPRFTG